MTMPPSAEEGLDPLLRKYATQAVSALAVVIGATGIMMFFRIAKGEVEAMHEWLGLAFVTAIILHVARHRRGFMAMLGQPRMRVLFGLTMVIAAAFVVLTPAKQGNPFRQMSQLATSAPLSALSPVLGVSPEELIRRLTDAGITVSGPDQSIDAAAKASGRNPVDALVAALGRK